VIVDEAHQFRGTLATDVLRQVSEVSARLVLASMPNLELPEGFPEDDATVVQWRRDQVLDNDGKALDAIPRPKLNVVQFHLSPAELVVRQAVGEMCRSFEKGLVQQRWIASSLQRALDSSPAALEATLSRISEYRNCSAHGRESLLNLSGEEWLEEQRDGRTDVGLADAVAGLAARTLSQLEATRDDSKLADFVTLVQRLAAVGTRSTRVCALTGYTGTLFYLAAELEALGKACRIFHGGMNAEGRHSALTLFSSEGGVLAATRAAISEGHVLTDVTDLVLYDVPGSPVALQQVLGHFDRIGRRTQLNVYALLPANGGAGHVREVVGILRQALGIPETVGGNG